MPRLNKLLVATDFSDSSRAALELGCELVGRLGVSLILVHAYQLPAYPLPEGVVMASAETAAAIVSTASTDLHAELDRARGLGAQAEGELVEGDPFDVIERLAREREIDLILMGTHGRRGLAHLLIGSVAEKMVRQGPCPVLTVRAPS